MCLKALETRFDADLVAFSRTKLWLQTQKSMSVHRSLCLRAGGRFQVIRFVDLAHMLSDRIIR